MNEKKGGLHPNVSLLAAWGLAFGCSVGWGSFVMPGTTFLPIAGPWGTVIGILIGAVIMLIIGVNYHHLMNRYPEAGGTYAFARNAFGYDHGFLCGGFLILTYVAIIWANATALPLIARNLLGNVFQFGFHYTIAGFDVYFGEVLLAIFALILAALICMRGKLGSGVMSVMAVILLLGIIVVFVYYLVSDVPREGALTPAYSPKNAPALGVFTIVSLAPWAYVGFESICHSAEEFTFPVKKTLKVLIAALLAAAFAYGALALLAARVLPAGAGNWTDYIFNLGSYPGIQGLPTFYAAQTLIGKLGSVVLGITAFAAILTGLVGNYIASSRLIYALGKDDMFPARFAKLDKNNIPKNAILLLLAISVILPFFGRTAISWIVDVTTVGAAIAYAYVSAAAYKTARQNSEKKAAVFGMTGLVISGLFLLYFLIPNLLGVTTLSTESYMILTAYSIFGFGFFLSRFRKDTQHRLGRVTITWVVLLGLIIYTSSVWLRQENERAAETAHELITLSEQQHGLYGNEAYVTEVLQRVEDSLTKNSVIQIALIAVALAIIFTIYSMMQKRERQLELDKLVAEESSRAKTSFLSNMSHEIRTPMNAIIGLDNIALKDPDLTPHTREQLEKIGSSAQHLLGLINDILDMSRIESGRMVIKEEEFSFRDLLDQVNVIINGQCVDKGLDYECRIIGHAEDYYIGDDMKLKQVMINILGNAVKFTNVPGSVTFTVEQTASFEGFRTIKFVMADTGIGMSPEYLPKIFDAFSQEKTGTSNKYGSTGLGMAITKNIVEMMNGEIHVESEKGVGTTFTVTVTLKASARSVSDEHSDALPSGLKMLIVDDDEVACEHAQLVGASLGITSDMIQSGSDALKKVQSAINAGKPYDIVLTDFRMPEMDGIEFTRRIRAFDQGKTMVIVLTGYSWDDIQNEAREAGVDGIMSKPVFTDSLMRQIHKVIELREKAAENPDEVKGLVAPEPEEETGTLEGLNILIAEDFDINAEILMDLLEMEGMMADRAENGQMAVDMFSENPENYYAAILMDVRMPVMDGLTAAKTIRALDRGDAKTIPIIALTANAFDEDVQRSLQAGMSAHLSKPVEPDRLYETLEKLLHPEE